MNVPARLHFVLLLLVGVVVVQGQSRGTKFEGAIGRQRPQPLSPSDPNKWHVFIGPDNDFTIEFPSKPVREEDAQGIIGVIRRYSSTTDRYYFGIVYQDVGPAASNLIPTHEEESAALLQERGHKVISARRLSKNVTQMELWSPSQTPGKFLHRIDRTVVRHDRMYTLGCSSRIAEKEVDKAVCRRFFNSFRMIGVPR